MKIIENKNAKIIYQSIFEQEFYSTIDEGWTIDNDSLESKLYLSLSEESKTVYAMNHAKQYANELMKMEEEDFFENFGNQYLE